jgi:hypothetical protein
VIQWQHRVSLRLLQVHDEIFQAIAATLKAAEGKLLSKELINQISVGAEMVKLTTFQWLRCREQAPSNRRNGFCPRA